MIAASRNRRRPILVPLAIAAWCAIPALELLSLSVAYDAGHLLRGGRVPTGATALVAWAPHAGRLAVAFVLAMILHGGKAWWGEFLRLVDQGTGRPARPRLAATLFHGLSFAAFAGLTGLILAPGAATVEAASLAWPASALSVAASWCLILAPARDWAELIRRRRGSLLAGAAIAAAAWLAGLLTQTLWEPLADATLATSRLLLGLVAPETVSDASERILGTPTYQVSIAPACSGYEGIGLLWVVLGTYLWLSRASYRFPAALILFPLGTLLIWLANSARIAALILVGTHVSEDLAMGGFHSQAGWIALNAVTFGLIALASRWNWLRPGDAGATAGGADAAVNPTAPLVAPLVVVLAAALATSAFTAAGSPDLAYGIRVVAGFATLAFYRRSYRGRWGALGAPEVAWGTLCGLAVFAIWMALEPTPSSPSPLPAMLAGLPRPLALAWVALKLLGSVALIPIVEELAFRGFAIRRLISAEFETLPLQASTWPALLISSVLFGAMHDRWLAGTLAGLCFGLSLRRAGSLREAMLAHAVANALIAAAVLGWGAWSLW